MRRLGIGILATIACVSFSGRSARSTEYQVIDLGVLTGGSQSEAFDINKEGQVVGYSLASNGEDHAFLFSGGTMQDLGVLNGDAWSQAYAINDNGVIVGASWSASPG
jgi:probable HAF family extracellular repeat protein